MLARKIGIVLPGKWILMVALLSGCASLGQEEEAIWKPAGGGSTAPYSQPPFEANLPTEAACFDDVAFLGDVTIPDGSQVAPREKLDKRWSTKNTGTCDWDRRYRLVRLGEDAFEGPDEIALYPARAGTQAIWQVFLGAPSEPGRYTSRWQARSPEGLLFGDPVYVTIVVVEETPPPAHSPTP